MKHFSASLLLSLSAAALPPAVYAAGPVNPEREAATVRLDDTGVKNLGLELTETDEHEFEETVFVLGKLQANPTKRAVVSSRIAGRAVSVKAYPDAPIAEGAEAVVVESRLPGNPPPEITLVAPISGHVTKVNIVTGQPVAPDDVLVEIVDLSLLHAMGEVPEHLVGKLKPGQPAVIRTPAFPDRSFPATLAHLGTEVESQGTLEAAFHVQNADLALRPGMRAEFSITVSKRGGVLSIPKSALLGEPSSRFVYVADDELKNTFIKTPVVVGAMNDRLAEITDGLFPGDKVVSKGGYSLSFAGKGSVSLKEALDAAHGHEHNEDGTEMTAEQKASKGAAKGDGHDHGHEHAELSSLTLFSLIANGLLLLIVILMSFSRGKPAAQS